MTVTVGSTTVLADIRAAIVDAVTTDGAVYAYGYPDPQVEYPAVVLPTVDAVQFHASVGCDGVLIVWTVEVMVAQGETESAVADVEALGLYVAALLEAIDPAPWAQLIVHRLENFRAREQAGAMSADLVVEIHA